MKKNFEKKPLQAIGIHRKQSLSRSLTEGGMIAAVYVILTMLSASAGLSSGVIQVRLSEALCVLPFFSASAIGGLTIGCMLSNILTGGLPMDVLFGSLATLLGAIGAYTIGFLFRKNGHLGHRLWKIAVSVPNLIANTLIIPWVLRLVYGAAGSIWYFMLTVGLGELVGGSILGTVLLFALEKHLPHFHR